MSHNRPAMKFHADKVVKNISESLRLDHLLDRPNSNSLELVLHDSANKYRFLFIEPNAYRCTVEEYALMIDIESKNKLPAPICAVENSPWMQHLITNEPLFTHHEDINNIRHYIFVTEHSVIEVLARTEFQVEILRITK